MWDFQSTKHEHQPRDDNLKSETATKQYRCYIGEYYELYSYGSILIVHYPVLDMQERQRVGG
jgi:hypothetical protein